MDEITKELMRFGLAGALIAVVVTICWFLLSATIKDRDAALAFYRNELGAHASRQAEAVTEERLACKAMLTQMEMRWTMEMKAILERMGSLEERRSKPRS